MVKGRVGVDGSFIVVGGVMVSVYVGRHGLIAVDMVYKVVGGG